MSLKDVMNKVKATDAPPVATFDVGAAVWAYYASLNEAVDEARDDGYHPSQMYGFCPRQEILRYFFPKPDANIITPELQTAFDWGTAWHWFLQNRLFGPMGHLWGEWRCNRCGQRIRDSFMPSPHLDCLPGVVQLREAEIVRLVQVEKEIEAGKRPRRGGYWTYMEPKLHSGEWNIFGQGDGIFYPKPWSMTESEPVLLEIKTSNDNGFQRLYKPDPKYVFQISLYLHLLGLRRCLLTYWSKGDPQKPKSFWMDEDKTAWSETTSRIILHRRSWPEKRLCSGICKDAGSDQGRWCGWSRECFQKDIEEQVEKARNANALRGGPTDAG